MRLPLPSPEFKHDQSSFGGQIGLSFVEVMVTIFIMALATSVIIFTVPKPDAQPAEITKLRSTLEKASERARMIGSPTGLTIFEDGYEVADWRGGAWHPVSGTRSALRAQTKITVLSLTRRDQNLPEEWPSVVFDPLGHTSPVDLDISVGRTSRRLSIEFGGAMRSEGRDE